MSQQMQRYYPIYKDPDRATLRQINRDRREQRRPRDPYDYYDWDDDWDWGRDWDRWDRDGCRDRDRDRDRDRRKDRDRDKGKDRACPQLPGTLLRIFIPAGAVINLLNLFEISSPSGICLFVRVPKKGKGHKGLFDQIRQAGGTVEVLA